jgi:hypothetical protein
MENNLFWYELTLRGLSPGAQPMDFVDHREDVGRFGIVAYNRPLTKDELFNYDLVPYKMP